MKIQFSHLFVLSMLSSCSMHTPPTTEILMAPLNVGTKTSDFEVVSPTKLQLAPGVTVQVLEGANGQNNGFELIKNNGRAPGGFMACGCVGAQTSSCITDNDIPGQASCSGSCSDSEGNIHACQLEGPLIGPPKGPFSIKFIDIR